MKVTMDSIPVSLPPEVWQNIHAMIHGHRAPFHVERQTVQVFEAALHAAQHPPKPTDGISDG